MNRVIEIRGDRHRNETPYSPNVSRGKSVGRLVMLALSFVAVLALSSEGYSQPKPDLVIRDAKMTVRQENGVVKRADLTVKILNYCQGTQAVKTGMHLVFSAPPGPGISEILLNTHVSVGAIKGGDTLTLLVTILPTTQAVHGGGYQLLKWLTEAQRLPSARMVVDVPNFNAEANEKNNEYTMNPDKKPSQLSGQFQCSPKM